MHGTRNEVSFQSLREMETGSLFRLVKDSPEAALLVAQDPSLAGRRDGRGKPLIHFAVYHESAGIAACRDGAIGGIADEANGITARFQAAMINPSAAMVVLLEHPEYLEDTDSMGRSIRSVIQTKWPEIAKKVASLKEEKRKG